MHARWNVFPLLAVLTFVPVSVFAGAPAGQSVGDKTKEGAVKTKDAVVKGTKAVGGATKDGLSKTGEVITDGWITSRIHERFIGEDLLKDSDINVDTDKHTVTLKGTVRTSAARARAVSIAKGTEGVNRVINRLTIGSKHEG